MKTLFLLTGLSQGGLETYLLRFVRFLNKSSESVVFCKSGRMGELEQAFRDAGARVVAFPLGYIRVWDYWRFYRFLRREKFTSVCDFTGNFAGIPLLCARVAGVNVRVAQYRGAEDHFVSTWWKQIYNRGVKSLVFRFATHIVSNSEAALDYFFPGIWKQNARFRVIYNGVDIKAITTLSTRQVLRRAIGVPDNAFVVGHTGRYNYAKNHETIIEVAFRLCRRYPEIYFVLVGKEVDSVFAEKVKEKGLEGRILLLGYRKDVLELLHTFDLFYFPSVTEGQPNSLLEAEVAGLPIVASDIPSIQESVPKAFIPKLLPARDVNRAEEIIESLFKNDTLRDLYRCRDWAISRFDGKKRFEEFWKILACN